MWLGIDLGTGSAKALLLDESGSAIAEASSPYSVQAPQSGWAETEPAEWWNAVAIAVRSVTANQSNSVTAIGLSGQMHGVVLTNADGEPLRPAILWADGRSGVTLQPYHQLDPDLRRSLANPITAGMAGPTLLWLRDHEPEVYQSARWALQPKDWLRLWLTDAVATEPSDASGTLLYDVWGDRWALPVLDALHLRSDWLPKLVPSHEIAGTLTDHAASELGLLSGIPVVAGASDTAAAMLGSGLVRPDLTQLTVGSGAQIVTPSLTPEVDPYYRTHQFRSAIPQQWYTLAAIQNAGLALEWVRQILGLSWQEVYAEAFQVPAGCEGLTFLPYLTGDRTPHLNSQARGAWVGLGLHHTRAHLMRAALEGVAFSIRQGLKAIAATSTAPTQLYLAGGGTLEPSWKQLLTDILQVPLYPVTIAAASARGAALLAGLGAGAWDSVDHLLDSLPPIAVTEGAIAIPNPSDPAIREAGDRFDALYPMLHSN